MITELNKLSIISSTEFQAYYTKSEAMDLALESSIAQNSDIPAILAVKHSARITLPYGCWTCKDKSEVFFNRGYQPLFKRANGVNSFMLPDHFVQDIEKVVYFYGDHNSPVKYLLRKFTDHSLDASEREECRKSLAICLQLLQDYSPKNDNQICQTWKAFSFN